MVLYILVYKYARSQSDDMASCRIMQYNAMLCMDLISVQRMRLVVVICPREWSISTSLLLQRRDIVSLIADNKVKHVHICDEQSQ